MPAYEFALFYVGPGGVLGAGRRSILHLRRVALFACKIYGGIKN